MIDVTIPGHKRLQLEHLVLDYNGTLACDGELLPDVRDRLDALADKLQVHVLTADTFGKARGRLDGTPCRLSILPANRQDAAKRDYVDRLGAASVAAVGNGRNDRLMLQTAALGIAVVQEEGAAADTVAAADVVCRDIASALGLLTDPLRLVATLRS